jgi:hypothetical protein
MFEYPSVSLASMECFRDKSRLCELLEMGTDLRCCGRHAGKCSDAKLSKRIVYGRLNLVYREFGRRLSSILPDALEANGAIDWWKHGHYEVRSIVKSSGGKKSVQVSLVLRTFGNATAEIPQELLMGCEGPFEVKMNYSLHEANLRSPKMDPLLCASMFPQLGRRLRRALTDMVALKDPPQLALEAPPAADSCEAEALDDAPAVAASGSGGQEETRTMAAEITEEAVPADVE